MKLSKLIAIVSYLPDDMTIRNNRFTKLIALIDRCNELFNLPIYILIQNYTDSEIETIKSKKNVKVSTNYPRLGITGARKQLRADCISSPYEYFIMLDDDSELEGEKHDADKYLEDIDDHPGCFANFKNRQLKLFAICKEIFTAVEYADINPEDRIGFEDTVFIARCDKYFGERRFRFRDSKLRDACLGAKDSDSTWWTPDVSLPDMLQKTAEIIDKESRK